jgi:hypothetical protein
MKKHKLEELNQHYKDAESCDDEIFSEMRSNLLLVSGNHYSKKTSSFFSRIRNTARLNETQKLRLTKNHLHKITRHYIQAITSKVPGVIPMAQNPLDMQDKKAADLNLAVWKDTVTRYQLKEKFNDFIQNFVEIGEMCAFIFWNPFEGDVKGFEPLVDEATGQPVVDPMTGQPRMDESKPIFTGGFEFKNIPAFNLMRAPQAKSMKKSPYHIIREMVDKQELNSTFGDDEGKKKIIGEGDTGEFIVFDTNKKQYRSEESQILVRYHFFRPCKLYPKGYYYIATERGILEEGEIPFGIYPIIWEGFDTYSTNPRAYSIIKVARPYQAEINRASSQAATHQITVGDDKIIYQAGTKLAPGALLPGVRGLTFQGAPPQILAGRDGGQFLPYIESQITEMYSACMLDEINAEKSGGQIDAYTLLFRSASAKAKFSRYIEKVEAFMKEFCMTTLALAKQYLPEDALIQAVGKSEVINIVEFRDTMPIHCQIKIEEQAQDISDRLGQQLALNHLIQYAGQQMDPKQLALLAKEMPYLKSSSIVKKLTLDYDNAENDMLQIERGQMPFISPYTDNKICMDEVTHRMKQADFQLLAPEIQQMYDEYLRIHEEETGRKVEAAQRAKDGFIPTGGSLITVQMQVADPSSQSGTRQVRLPYETIQWLIKQFEAQGVTLQDLENMNDGVVADMVQRMGPQQGQAQMGMPPQAMPGNFEQIQRPPIPMDQ